MLAVRTQCWAAPVQWLMSCSSRKSPTSPMPPRSGWIMRWASTSPRWRSRPWISLQKVLSTELGPLLTTVGMKPGSSSTPPLAWRSTTWATGRLTQPSVSSWAGRRLRRSRPSCTSAGWGTHVVAVRHFGHVAEISRRALGAFAKGNFAARETAQRQRQVDHHVLEVLADVQRGGRLVVARQLERRAVGQHAVGRTDAQLAHAQQIGVQLQLREAPEKGLPRQAA